MKRIFIIFFVLSSLPISNSCKSCHTMQLIKLHILPICISDHFQQCFETSVGTQVGISFFPTLFLLIISISAIRSEISLITGRHLLKLNKPRAWSGLASQRLPITHPRPVVLNHDEQDCGGQLMQSCHDKHKLPSMT